MKKPCLETQTTPLWIYLGSGIQLNYKDLPVMDLSGMWDTGLSGALRDKCYGYLQSFAGG